MRFKDITGNDDVKRALVGMVDSGRIPHAIMFHEDDGGGAVPMALAFLQYVFCRQRQDGDSCAECPRCGKISKMIHPDVHFTFPVATGGKISKTENALSDVYLPQWRELVASNPYFTESELLETLGVAGKSTSIYVAEAEAIINIFTLNPVEGGYRAVVIYLPEKLNANAANRLLKSIEEPMPQTIFLLITHSPEDVILTIRSRCQLMRVRPDGRRNPAQAEVSANEEIFRRLVQALSGRDLVAALEIADELAALPSREAAVSFCEDATRYLRWLFLMGQGMESLAGLNQERKAWYGSVAASVKKSFPRAAMSHFDKARMLIERNVNIKILFCDLVDKLTMTI